MRDLPETRKSTLALQADKKASFGTIIKVMDALKLAGVQKFAGVYAGRENDPADFASERPDPAGRKANRSTT